MAATSQFPGILASVAVATDGALTGDGTSGNKLAVAVDDSSIVVNASNELAAVGIGTTTISDATLGPELFSGVGVVLGAGWAGSGAGPYTHTAGTATLVFPAVVPTFGAGVTYQIVATQASGTTGQAVITLGARSSDFDGRLTMDGGAGAAVYSGTITTQDATALTVTPGTSYNGAFTLSVKRVIPGVLASNPYFQGYDIAGDPVSVQSVDDQGNFQFITQDIGVELNVHSNEFKTAGTWDAFLELMAIGDNNDGNAQLAFVVHGNDTQSQVFSLNLDGGQFGLDKCFYIFEHTDFTTPLLIQPNSGTPLISFEGQVNIDGAFRVDGVTFTNLPGSPVAGMLAYVTDSNTATWGATIGGSSTNKVLAFYNGTNWTVAGK